MKLARVSGLFCLVLAGCASAPKPEPASAPPVAQAPVAQPEEAPSAKAPEPPPAEPAPIEKKVAAEPAPNARPEAFDPLAVGSDVEESSVPQMEVTPANQVRPHSVGELNHALQAVQSEGSVDDAAKKLTQRLGKPSWTEISKGSSKAKRRIWIAAGGASCHRLVLEPDGSVELESASKTEWRMLSASARQNPCTGEIKRGISDK